MAKIDIEYRHTTAPLGDPSIRRRTTAAMASYINDLVCEMQMEDISCKFVETIIEEGPNTVIINGRTIPEIIEGLQIKYLETEEGMVSFGRPVLDWKREYVEDVPDTIMKNAIAKVYADSNKNDLPVMN
ncbi:MAG: hypothetical protein IKR86_07775 [Candidatus Methanomethylophilaceae archaeon]|jgi:hypothetical protein|nr:hypothetical protein [Candidatus Methanomethylophilaceae archaeon]